MVLSRHRRGPAASATLFAWVGGDARPERTSTSPRSERWSKSASSARGAPLRSGARGKSPTRPRSSKQRRRRAGALWKSLRGRLRWTRWLDEQRKGRPGRLQQVLPAKRLPPPARRRRPRPHGKQLKLRLRVKRQRPPATQQKPKLHAKRQRLRLRAKRQRPRPPAKRQKPKPHAERQEPKPRAERPRLRAKWLRPRPPGKQQKPRPPAKRQTRKLDELQTSYDRRSHTRSRRTPSPGRDCRSRIGSRHGTTPSAEPASRRVSTLLLGKSLCTREPSRPAAWSQRLAAWWCGF